MVLIFDPKERNRNMNHRVELCILKTFRPSKSSRYAEDQDRFGLNSQPHGTGHLASLKSTILEKKPPPFLRSKNAQQKSTTTIIIRINRLFLLN